MCLPFIRGGDRGDHGPPAHQGIHRSLPPSPPLSPQPRYVPPYQEDGQPYKPVAASPLKEAYGHRTPGMAAGGQGKNGGADAAPRHEAGVNKNGQRMTAFDDNSDADAPACVGVVVRGRKSVAENEAPTLAAQAPHQCKDVSASPPLHGSVVASNPKEAADKVRAPPVVQMARRGGGEGNYPAAAATTPMPTANNFYGDRRDHDDDHAYGDKDYRKPQGNSWW